MNQPFQTTFYHKSVVDKSSNNIVIKPSPALPTPTTDFRLAPATPSPYIGARFLLECARKLDLESVTTATAAALFHSFFRAARPDEALYDPFLISGACLYLAGKLEECQQLRVRDVINVVQATLHPGSEPLGLESEYYNMREAICQAELLVLRMVRFQTKFDHPHKYLLHHLRSLKDWISDEVWRKYPIAKTSWALLQDFYHDARVMDAEGAHVSVACIAIAMETYGIQIPFVGDNTSWVTAFSESLTKERLWELMVIIMEVYANDAIFISPLKTEIKKM